MDMKTVCCLLAHDILETLIDLCLLLQTFADSEMHAFEFKSLQDSLDEIKASISPLNIRFSLFSD